VKAPAKASLFVLLTALVVLGLVSTVVRDRASEPYGIPKSALAGWNVVVGHPDDPWLIAARPPSALSAALIQQLIAKARIALVPLPRPDLPLVLRSEYADALQGMWSVDEIGRVARDSGIESAAFEPVCVGHKTGSGSEAPEFFFVAFTSPIFERLRSALQPDFPEHAGIITYDPRALSLVLPLAATNRDINQWWPLTFDALTDCQAQVIVR